MLGPRVHDFLWRVKDEGLVEITPVQRLRVSTCRIEQEITAELFKLMIATFLYKNCFILRILDAVSVIAK